MTDAFDLIVANNATPPKMLETWTKISMSGKPGYRLPAALNDPNARSSQYVAAYGLPDGEQDGATHADLRAACCSPTAWMIPSAARR